MGKCFSRLAHRQLRSCSGMLVLSEVKGSKSCIRKASSAYGGWKNESMQRGRPIHNKAIRLTLLKLVY